MRDDEIRTAYPNRETRLRVLEEQTRNIGRVIGDVFDRHGALFCLIGFEPGAGDWLTYICNAEREDMVKLLREMADKLEAGEDRKPMREN